MLISKNADMLSPSPHNPPERESAMPKTKKPPSNDDRRLNFILDEVTEKILRVLLENPTIPYNKSTLAEVSNVSRDALYRRWDKFKELGIIEESEIGGGSKYYQLNTDSELVDQIGRMLYLDD